MHLFERLLAEEFNFHTQDSDEEQRLIDLAFDSGTDPNKVKVPITHSTRSGYLEGIKATLNWLTEEGVDPFGEGFALREANGEYQSFSNLTLLGAVGDRCRLEAEAENENTRREYCKLAAKIKKLDDK